MTDKENFKIWQDMSALIVLHSEYMHKINDHKQHIEDKYTQEKRRYVLSNGKADFGRDLQNDIDSHHEALSHLYEKVHDVRRGYIRYATLLLINFASGNCLLTSMKSYVASKAVGKVLPAEIENQIMEFVGDGKDAYRAWKHYPLPKLYFSKSLEGARGELLDLFDLDDG